jgi:hypothetical protein
MVEIDLHVAVADLAGELDEHGREHDGQQAPQRRLFLIDEDLEDVELAQGVRVVPLVLLAGPGQHREVVLHLLERAPGQAVRGALDLAALLGEPDASARPGDLEGDLRDVEADERPSRPHRFHRRRSRSDEGVHDASARKGLDDAAGGFGMHPRRIGVEPVREGQLRVRIDAEAVRQLGAEFRIAGNAAASAGCAQAAFAPAHGVC